MNRVALRYALRQCTAYFLLTGAALYAWQAIATNTPSTGVWAGVFVVFAIGTAAFRYRDSCDQQTRASEQAVYAARVAEQRAEHQAFLEGLDAERAERDRVRTEKLRDDVLAGRRCPAWCDDCDEEQRRSDEDHARFLAERAIRHGHPNAGDLQTLAPLAVLTDIEDRHVERLDGLAELNRKLHPGYSDESPI